METAPSTPISEDALYEVIAGQIVGQVSKWALMKPVASQLIRLMNTSNVVNELGHVVSEILFRLDPAHEISKRRPDVAFVSVLTRWPRNLPRGAKEEAWDVVPDLVIEVVSPTNTAVDRSHHQKFENICTGRRATGLGNLSGSRVAVYVATI